MFWLRNKKTNFQYVLLSEGLHVCMGESFQDYLSGVTLNILSSVCLEKQFLVFFLSGRLRPVYCIYHI